MLQLRPYQQEMIDRTRDMLKSHRSVLLQAPTGAGKTAITVMMMATAAARGKRAYFLVHQNELLTQTSRALWKQKLEHGMISAGKRASKLPVQVASVQTLVRRLDRYPAPDLIITDECHRAASSTYQKIYEAYPNAKVVGLTATPQRTDGKGLDESFDALVCGPSIRQLIEAGYLCKYEIIAPKTAIDFSSVKTRMGDFASDQVEQVIDKPSITGDAVSAYKQFANGKRCVVMCVSVKHAKHVADMYNAAGIKAEAMDGTQTNAEREATIGRFERGETLVVASVNLLVEGVDLPSIAVVQWLRPTKSLIIYMQGNGRGLRPAAGKDKLIILDQVSNWTRHGLPDDDREWSLEGKKKNIKRHDDEVDVNIAQCEHCQAVFRKGPTHCPRCGVILPVRLRAEIQQVDGELAKIDIDAVRREQKKEQASARSLRDLISLGMRRGMKNPSGWAANVYFARSGRKPSPADYKQASNMMMELAR